MKILNKLLIGLAFCFFFHPVMTKAQTVVSFDGTNLCYNDNSGGIKCVNVTGVPITTVSGLSAYNSRPAGSLVTVTDGASSTDCSTGGGSNKVLCQFQGGTTWSAVAQSGVSGVSSFNGRSGAVSPSSGDYSVAQVTGAAPAASPTFSGTIAAALGTNFDFSNITLVNFPTLNQNTTGSAAKWTTARLLAGNSVDGSANVLFANKFIVQGTSDSGLSGAQFLGSLGTGIIKNTTTTGVLSIAAAGDFPTLNQNTTGTAAGLTGCSPSTAGSLCYWNGLAWTLLVGNTTQTNWLQETSAGVPSWTTPSGSGTVTASPQFEIPDYSAPGTASTITGLSWLTGRDGVPQTLTETTSAGSPTAPVAAVSGIVPNAQAGTTYIIAATDRNKWVTFSNAASIAVTLPQAGSTGFDANFIVHACDIGAGTATITPTTSTISYTNGSAYTSGAASLALTTGQCATILDDATGSNYTGSVYAGGGSSGLSGMTAGQVPIAATSTTVTSSKAIQGTDTSLLSSGTISGTGATLCTDANGGATTTGCSSGGTQKFFKLNCGSNGFPSSDTVATSSAYATTCTPESTITPAVGDTFYLQWTATVPTVTGTTGNYDGLISPFLGSYASANDLYDSAVNSGTTAGTNSYLTEKVMCSVTTAGASGAVKCNNVYPRISEWNGGTAVNFDTNGVKSTSSLNLSGSPTFVFGPPTNWIGANEVSKLSSPATPTIAAVSGGTIAASTQVNVQVTYVNAQGQTIGQTASNVTTSGTCTASGNCSVQVTSPAAAASGCAAATGYNIYAANGASPGTYFLQNTSGAISIGTSFTFGTAGNPEQTSGTALPGSSTAYATCQQLISVAGWYAQ